MQEWYLPEGVPILKVGRTITPQDEIKKKIWYKFSNQNIWGFSALSSVFPILKFGLAHAYARSFQVPPLYSNIQTRMNFLRHGCECTGKRNRNRNLSNFHNFLFFISLRRRLSSIWLYLMYIMRSKLRYIYSCFFSFSCMARRNAIWYV